MKIILQNKELDIKSTVIDGLKIAEITSDEVLINDVKSGTELLVDIYYQDFDKIIIDERNINPEFFDLKSGFAGEILQTISNFRLKLAVKGDYSKYSSNSLSSFISESNKLGHISFVDTDTE